QPTREHCPSPKKCADRPHPEVPPRKRPRTNPTPEPELQEAQGQGHGEPASACVPFTQAHALHELVRRASEGNEVCRQGLRDLLDKTPALWEVAGNVAALAERHWVELI